MSPLGQAVAHGRTARLTRPEVPDGGEAPSSLPNQPAARVTGMARSWHLSSQSRQAIKQIERRRRFWVRVTMGTVAMTIVVIIWALTEYHNAGGWPTQGFSDSSSIPNV
jgi:hypothetical protein